MLSISKLPSIPGYVEVEVNGKRRLKNIKTGQFYEDDLLNAPRYTDIQLAQQEITDKDLALIEQGQSLTELELATIEQGQAQTDLELTILNGGM